MNRADRKKQLIAQGAVYRAEMILCKLAAQQSLQPDSLAKSALQQLGFAAFSVFKNRKFAGLPGLNLRTMLPLAMSGISILRKRSMPNIVMRGSLIAAVVAGVAALISSKKKVRREARSKHEL